MGFKDGVGDIETLTRIRSRMGDRLTYIGGMPTAETFALPYRDIGIDTYSSAIFNFMPTWALRFYGAVQAGDRATVQHHLKDFVMPYIAIRNRAKGLCGVDRQGGMRIVGRPAGHVRSPLTELGPKDLDDLRALIKRARVAGLDQARSQGKASDGFAA